MRAGCRIISLGDSFTTPARFFVARLHIKGVKAKTSAKSLNDTTHGDPGRFLGHIRLFLDWRHLSGFYRIFFEGKKLPLSHSIVPGN
jgi:hypothetical protein